MGYKPNAYLVMLDSIIRQNRTIEELAADAGVARSSAERFIKGLAARVFIETWRRDPRASAAYRFTLTPRKDAPKPPPMTKAERDARYNANRKKRARSVFDLEARRRASLRVANSLPRSDTGQFLKKGSSHEVPHLP